MEKEYSERKGKSFWDLYKVLIEERLKEIDVFLKTCDPPLDILRAAKLLDITVEEFLYIFEENGFEMLNGYTFFEVMKCGSSEICGYFRRELSRGAPKRYSPADISYIYNIEMDKIMKACKEVGIEDFDRNTLKILLDNILA